MSVDAAGDLRCHKLGHHLGFYQELEIRQKPWQLVNFCA